MASGPEFDEAVDWTSAVPSNQNGQVERRLQNLERKWAAHLFLDAWQSNQEFPHPNQSVNVLNFFEGNGVLDTRGILIAGDPTNPRGIYWVEDPGSDLAVPYVYVLGKVGGGSAADMNIRAQDGTDDYADIQLISSGGSSQVVLKGKTSVAGSSGLDSPSAFITTAGAVIGGFYISQAVLGLYSTTSDYATGDGTLWYRSDTDAIRARIDGATVSLLHSGSVIVLTSLDLPYVSVAVNTLATSTQCFIDVDASGASRTITLPSAATS